MSKGALKRAAELEKSRLFIIYLKNRIKYAAVSFDEITKLYISEKGDDIPYYLSAYYTSKETFAHKKILAAINENPDKITLKTQDRACILSFFNELVSKDQESAFSLCCLYESMIEERKLSADDFAKKYSGMFKMMGILCGLALLILLY